MTQQTDRLSAALAGRYRPEWMIDSLDQEAARLGVTRQSIIKVWIAERLEKRAS